MTRSAKHTLVISMALYVVLWTVPSLAGAGRALWKVRPAAAVSIEIDANTVVRETLPDTLFGFNINYRRFQQDLWELKTQTTRAEIVEYLKPFAGGLYRYPGGTIANNFVWREAIGPYPKRKPQGPPYGGAPARVLFGIDEYLRFLGDVDGRRFYVMNLGLAHESPFQEVGRDEAAKHNRELAEYLVSKSATSDFPNYYQLGNELDRYKYEWPASKYVDRSRDAIEAVSAVDKSARFVAFFRDFKWKYKDPKRGHSDQYEFMKEVLKGLPMVEDYSIHRYYDRKGGEKARTFWLKRLVRSIDVYKSVREGRSPRVWITEHGRQRSAAGDKSGEDRTNLSAAISAADYLISLSQIPEVAGACLHAGGAWSPFNEPGVRPRHVYWGQRVLRSQPLRMVMATTTRSPNNNAYKGGYDVRAVAFRDADRGALGLWVVNRASTATDAEISYRPFAGKKVSLEHTHISGREGHSPEDTGGEAEWTVEPKVEDEGFSNNGTLTLRIPPASVSSFVIRAK